MPPSLLDHSFEPLNRLLINKVNKSQKKFINSTRLVQEVFYNLGNILCGNTIVCNASKKYTFDVFLLTLSKKIESIYILDKKTLTDFKYILELVQSSIQDKALEVFHQYNNEEANSARTFIIDYPNLEHSWNLVEYFVSSNLHDEMIILNSYFSSVRYFLDQLEFHKDYFVIEHYPISYGFSVIKKINQLTSEDQEKLLNSWSLLYSGLQDSSANVKKVIRQETKLKEDITYLNNLKESLIEVCFSRISQIQQNLHNSLDGYDFLMPEFSSVSSHKASDLISLLYSVFNPRKNSILNVILFPDKLKSIRDSLDTFDKSLEDLDILTGNNNELVNFILVYKKILEQLVNLANVLFDIQETSFWLKYWHIDENTTWNFLIKNEYLFGKLFPKPVKSEAEYTSFYKLQSWSIPIRKTDPVELNQDSGTNPQQLTKSNLLSVNQLGSICHLFRYSSVLSIIEPICGILRHKYPDQTLRWLDIGCAQGKIACGARVVEIAGENCFVYGIDVNSSSISVANSKRVYNRKFYTVSPFSLPKEIEQHEFHIVTAFELLEHIFDPIGFLEYYSEFCSDYFIAGSPLKEASNFKPSQAHIWSFDREGYSSLFEQCGMNITYSSEVRVGSYIGGHDWLTVVASKKEKLPPMLK